MDYPSQQSLLILGRLNARPGRRNYLRSFGIWERDRLSHQLVLGKTGTGKSTFLLNLLMQDAWENRGFMLIDPHGDLSEKCLDLLPEHRIKDTIYFNPADAEYPIAFNPLDHRGPIPISLVSSGIISSLKKTWGEKSWGGRLEYNLRTSLMTLLSSPGTTFLDLHRLIVDKQFRERMLKHISDPQLLQFWKKEFSGYRQSFRSESVAPVLNKTGQYLSTPMVKNILGQPKNGFSLREVMDQGKIVIANLAQGRIGEDITTLIGSLLVSQLELAALSRADMPESERPPFYLYVDEAQLVANTTMVELFPQARKYRLSVTLAHQYKSQVNPDLHAAILGNVGTLTIFRLGAHDANSILPEFSPEFDAVDINRLPPYHAYIRLMVNGTSAVPFSFETLPPPETDFSFREEIIEWSRKKYARPRKDVEEDIMQYWESGGKDEKGK